MSLISDYTDKLNNSHKYDVQYEYREEEYWNEVDIRIRTASDNGEEPFSDIYDLISVMKKYRSFNIPCTFHICSEINHVEDIDIPLEFFNCIFVSYCSFTNISFKKSVAFLEK